MSLLWNDSLTYSSADFLAKSYPVSSGFSVAAGHPRALSKSSLKSSVGTLSLPGAPTSDTAVLGFFMKVSAKPAGFTDLISFKSAGGTALVKIQIGPGSTSDTVALRAVTGDATSEILLSDDIKLVNHWSFIEWKILFGNSGYAELHVDGNINGRYENQDTSGPADLTWASVSINPSNPAVDCFFAELYFGDTSNGFNFLGPCTSTRVFPGKASKWGWAPSPPSKKRLVILAGQSNINGRGQLPYTRSARNPNNSVRVWNNVAQVWQPMQAGIGSHPFYGPANTVWSFEMSFADQIASLFELSEPGADSNVHVIRLGADAAAVSNIPPEWILAGQPSWYPDIQYLGIDLSLSNRLFDVILPPAIAALGGWSEIEKVDIVWYQGESEASLLQGFMHEFVQSTNTVFDYFESRIPLPVTWHRIMCQRLGWRDGSSKLFPKIDEVRNLQRGNYHFRGNWIDTAEYGFWNDGVHMSEEGCHRLGLKVFESWLEAQGFTDRVKNYYFGGPLSPGDDYHAVSPGALDIGQGVVAYDQVPELQQDLVNSLVAGISCKLLVESDEAASVGVSLGGSALPTVSVGIDSPWTFRFSVRSGFSAPESAAGSMEISLL